MTPAARLAWAWSPEPTVLCGVAALAVAWAALARPRSPRRAAAFGAGATLLLLALVSPLDPLSDDYLFSAHMLQHVLLTFAVPPLLLAGVPQEAWARLLARPVPRAVERALGAPAPAFALAFGDLALWHVPALYDAALASEPLHALEHLTFLVAFTAFWWPVAGSPARRLVPGAAVAYLGLAAAACTALGVLVTFAPLGAWTHYLRADDPLRLRPALQAWLTPAEDQQLGGLLMWVATTPLLLVPVLRAVGQAFRGPPVAAPLPEDRA